MDQIETRLGWLESIAYWAKIAIIRREMYCALTREPEESSLDFIERKAEFWDQVKSADAMTKAALSAMERAYGPISLEARKS